MGSEDARSCATSTIEKVRHVAKMAREALGKLGEEFSRKAKVLGVTANIGPFSVTVEPDKPKCPECGEERK